MTNNVESLSASVQAKSGRLYAVMHVRDQGKSKTVWRALGLDEDAQPSKVNRAYREVVGSFEEEYELKQEKENEIEEIPVYEYMRKYLKQAKPNLQINTYRSYNQMIEGKIKTYFEDHPLLTVQNIKPKDIEDFYSYLFSFGVVANTVIHYHVVLHKAFKEAFKNELIEANPFDRIDRPKKNKFHGDHYTEEELVTMLELIKKEPIYPAVMLAGGMGLRRSEALGARWSRINWDNRSILLDTKIVEYDENGKKVLSPVEEMKNKSSRRTLYIPDPVYEMLTFVKEQQELNRKLFRESYNHEYDDYVCTDGLGNLLRPNYVTQRFSKVLEQNGLRHIRFHDLRHTFASILINQNVPLINVSNFLGHSTISTTANIYAHLDKSSKQETADIFSDIFNNVKGEEK